MTPRGTRPLSFGPNGPHRDADEPDLMKSVRRALPTGEPLGLLALASGVIATLDSRRVSPLDRLQGETASSVTLEALVESFIGVRRPETTALLACVALMAPDEALRDRARREVTSRPDRLPTWLARAQECRVSAALEMVHVLGDGDNLVFELIFAGGARMCLLVYVDHNLGTVVKDAFAVSEPLKGLRSFYESHAESAETQWRDLDPGEGRAKVTQAMALGDITYPPLETDTWPACQPLAEWVMRLLPEGGRGYERPEWDEDALEALLERFESSPFAIPTTAAPLRQLTEPLVHFAVDSGPGDPMRWSPVAVEILLESWLPRKFLAPVEFMVEIPTVLRAFVAFCHEERLIPAHLRTQTQAAIDRSEVPFAQLLQGSERSERAELFEHLASLLGDDDGLGGPFEDEFDDDVSYGHLLMGFLADDVGGEDALNALDGRALPDEPFDWTDLADDVRARVAEVLALADRYCDEVLDVEYRTACRRLLRRVADGDPNFFRRRGRSDTAAAALCWAIGRANYLFSASRGGLRNKDLMEYFGVPHSSVPQRATTMLAAAGINPSRYGDVVLGSPEFLVSARRRALIERREWVRREYIS